MTAAIAQISEYAAALILIYFAPFAALIKEANSNYSLPH
jgi:hypothetical protein